MRTLVNILTFLAIALLFILLGLILLAMVITSVVLLVEKIASLVGVSFHLIFWPLLLLTAGFLAAGIIFKNRQIKHRLQHLDHETDVVLRSFEVFSSDGYDEEKPGSLTRSIDIVTPLKTYVLITAKGKFMETFLPDSPLKPVSEDLWIASLANIKDSVDEVWRFHPWNYTVYYLIARDNISSERIINFIRKCHPSWKKRDTLRIAETLSREPDMDLAILSPNAEEDLDITMIHRRESTLPIAEITRALILDLIPETMQNKAEKRLLA